MNMMASMGMGGWTEADVPATTMLGSTSEEDRRVSRQLTLHGAQAGQP